MGAAESVADVRIVLVGKTGNGKSAAGNAILGKEAFVSKMATQSVTAACQKATAVLPDGRTLAVIDTPGFFDPESSRVATLAEVAKCVGFCSPGPHVILQVVRLGHFSPEEMEMARIVRSLFSLKAKAYLILLFTWKEDLDGRTLGEVLSEAGDISTPLRQQIESCGNRCLAFDNQARGKERRDQVDELIRMVDALVRENRSNPHYTKEMMEQDKARAPRWPCSIL